MYTTEASKVTELEAATTGVKKKKSWGEVTEKQNSLTHPSSPAKALTTTNQ